MGCNGNCTCKEKEIKTVYVEKPWGEQMMFAVPEEGMNIDTVDVVEEIRKEIVVYFSQMIKSRGSDYEKTTTREIYDAVLDIFYEFKK